MPASKDKAPLLSLELSCRVIGGRGVRFGQIASSGEKEVAENGFLEMAKAAEAAERYDDMCMFMKELTHSAVEHRSLSVEERNLLSVAYKNVIGARRASWRTLSMGEQELDGGHVVTVHQVYKTQIESELKACSMSIIDLLTTSLIKGDEEDEAQVFYLKMTGDYYRYLAECIPSDKSFRDNADTYYSKAYDIALKCLAPTHPVRLGLALNYSVCHFEILKDPKKACDLAKDAFDEAISKLDALQEDEYKDSTLIMQLLRDNLTLWTSNDPEQEVAVEDYEGED